uniref:Uncharacterized protein n=1 Tax=Oryza nivara TaxID=4536 RepID=A0A0E0IHE8_ORYNI
MAMAASSALLRSAARSIPRSLGAELRFSSRPTENAPRRLYSAAATAGPQGPQPNMTAQQGYLAEKGMSPEVMAYEANMNRALDKLEAKLDRLSAILKEREEQEKRYTR